MHAFIIEDDYLIGQSVEDMLSDLGFSRFSFARSEDAAILGSEDTYDLITADVHLLPGDGIKAVEIICKDRQIPVIFVTGYPQEAHERLELRLPGAAVLTKPIQQEALAAAVTAVLARSRASAVR